MDVSFERNIRAVERGLSDFARNQLPFATSLALNATAEEVRRNAVKALSRRLDRPTRFTLNAFGLKRSSKRRLAAAVFAKDRQAEYLIYQEKGGERAPKGKAVVVPVNLGTNRYGNMPRGAIKRNLARPDTFSGKPKGGGRPGGIYRRLPNGKGLRLLVDYAARASYSRRLRFRRDAEKTALARMPVQFERALRRAMATARR